MKNKIYRYNGTRATDTDHNLVFVKNYYKSMVSHNIDADLVADAIQNYMSSLQFVVFIIVFENFLTHNLLVKLLDFLNPKIVCVFPKKV